MRKTSELLYCADFRVVFVVSMVIAVLGLAAGPAWSKSIEEYKWIEVQSSNFRIRSPLSKSETVKALRHLELLRAVIPPHMLAYNRDKPVPDVIYLFKGSNQMKKIGFVDGWDQWFVSEHQGIKALSVNSNVFTTSRAIMNRYVRFLVNDEHWITKPTWYAEGLTVYFSRAEIYKGKFRYGEWSPWSRFDGMTVGFADEADLFSLRSLRLMSREQTTEMQYSSWLLVHYLRNGLDRKIHFGDSLRNYIDLVESGTEETVAFENAFGIAAQDLKRELSRYKVQDCCPVFGASPDKLLPSFEPQITRLTREEAALGLAHVAAGLSDRERAKRLFNVALTNPDTEPAARAGLQSISRQQ